MVCQVLLAKIITEMWIFNNIMGGSDSEPLSAVRLIISEYSSIVP